jgi:hypothetical protein
MGSHMKTTVEIADALFDEARRTAAREKTTMRALLEEGLRKVLDDRGRRDGFRLRKATFRGKGLQPGVAEAGWEGLRDLSYKGRGA